MNSFRIRIALLAGSISAVALLGMGWFLWQQTARWNLARIDHSLDEIGRDNLERTHGRSHFQRLDANLNAMGGTNRPPAYRLLLWENGEERRILYESTDWVAVWHPKSFPSLDGLRPKPDRARPKGGGRRGGRENDGPPLRLMNPVFETRTLAGEPWRIAVMGNRFDTLALALRIADHESDLAQLGRAYALALGLALVGVCAGSLWLAGRAIRPVRALTCVAEQVTAEGLDRRIEDRAYDHEFNRLITVFNEMMDRLEKSFRQAARFSADASHELKTPLAIMQGELERAIAHTGDDPEQQRLCAGMLEEVQRLKAIVQKLLLLSRADAGELKLVREPVDLSGMLIELADDAAILGPDLEIMTQVEPEVSVDLDPTLFSQVLRNLLSNAVKFNRKGGWIRIGLRRGEDRVEIVVSNSGVAIPTGNRERIFRRFYRESAEGGAATEGSGLGLSLAREIVRAQGGELSAVAPDEPEAAKFVLLLPAGHGPG